MRLWQAIPASKGIGAWRTRLVQRLLHASDGITGPVARLLSLAAVAAIRSSAERIDEAAIELVSAQLEKDAS